MNPRDKLLSAAMVIFFIIISSNCGSHAGDAVTVLIPLSTQSPPAPTQSPIESAVKPSPTTWVNCGSVAINDNLTQPEFEYQCWTIPAGTCFEDMNCWDCESMGNKICSREYWLTKLFGDSFNSGYAIEIDFQVRYEMEGN